MAPDIHQIVTLVIFFLGLALCMWRAPRADRWHVVLCGAASVLWCSLLAFEPRTRTPGYGFVVVTLLTIGFSQSINRRLSQTD